MKFSDLQSSKISRLWNKYTNCTPPPDILKKMQNRNKRSNKIEQDVDLFAFFTFLLIHNQAALYLITSIKVELKSFPTNSLWKKFPTLKEPFNKWVSTKIRPMFENQITKVQIGHFLKPGKKITILAGRYFCFPVELFHYSWYK